MLKITTKQQALEFLAKYDTFVFDCDGVLWQGNHLLDHVVETIDMLRSQGKRLIFVTNNSTKSRAAYTKKFETFGIHVTKDEIFGSAYSSAVYLDQVVKFPKNEKKVFVVGEKGIEDELAEVGIQCIGGTDPKFNTNIAPNAIDNLAVDPSIGAVIVGLDSHFNYYKIAFAMQQLRNEQTLFLATNIDSTYPAHGKLLPGAGTVVSAVQTCSGRNPVALGKPSDAMMDCVKAKFHLDVSRTCMVGDRLNTDMVFGRKGGLGTLFVLTGIDTEASALEPNAIVKPDYCVDMLGLLYILSRD